MLMVIVTDDSEQVVVRRLGGSKHGAKVLLMRNLDSEPHDINVTT